MAIVEVLLWIAVIGGLLWTLATALKRQQQEERLQAAFYRLLDEQDGYISLIQLAALARVNAIAAQEYLETQAHTFKADLSIDADGDSFYRFPKLSLKSSDLVN